VKTYKHIFFDLDRTLWDFDKNSEETLFEIFNRWLEKPDFNCKFQKFLDLYREVNHALWEDYRQGKITKEFLNVERFSKTMRLLGFANIGDAYEMADFYVEESPKKTSLFPGTVEILDYLNKKYILHIITNGFEEIQFRKLKNSELEKYFQCIITSEQAGTKKPDNGIFEYALKQSEAKVEESIMIGDDPEVDILGAKNIGMDSIFVNFDHISYETKATFEVKNLNEIKAIL
jgi:putative hydrolase of the HAD superfamily